VKSALPGSVLHITTSRGGSYNVPVPATGSIAIDLPKGAVGPVTVTVSDAGSLLASRVVTIT
jgi:hypothetical protein